PFRTSSRPGPTRDHGSHRVHPHRFGIRNSLRSVSRAKELLPKDVSQNADIPPVHAHEDQPEATLSSHLRDAPSEARGRLLRSIHLAGTIQQTQDHSRADVQIAAMSL